MPEYRRIFAPGGTFFLTLVMHERRRIFADAAAVSQLRSAVATIRCEHPFEILASVVMPDHIHFLWELPPDDWDYSTRVGKLKVAFTRAVRQTQTPTGSPSPSRRRHRESGVWQRRFWEHTIRDENDFGAHMDYIHFNPVKHELASCPHVWRYSSFRRWVREGAYTSNWLCACDGRRPRPPRFQGIAGDAGE